MVHGVRRLQRSSGGVSGLRVSREDVVDLARSLATGVLLTRCGTRQRSCGERRGPVLASATKGWQSSRTRLPKVSGSVVGGNELRFANLRSGSSIELRSVSMRRRCDSGGSHSRISTHEPLHHTRCKHSRSALHHTRKRQWLFGALDVRPVRERQTRACAKAAEPSRSHRTIACRLGGCRNDQRAGAAESLSD
jgi:hypothetical protein